MAYNALNNLIDAYIYANGVQAITGQILNGVLKQMVSQLGSGYHLMGVAGPETTPEQNDYAMAYFAATAGEYTDFGGITLAPGEVAVLLTFGNGSWEKRTIYNVPTGTDDLENTANFITNAVTDLVNYYTKTEVDDTLENYPTLEALATALADYYTKQEIDTTLEGYPTKQDQETALGDYYTKDEMDAALGDRYTKDETDTKLADYYKKTETYDKDEVDSIVAALSRQEYIVAWDGLAAPDVSAIPAGVTVTYSGTTYTGTLAASASTVNKIYMVWNGTAYDMYGTSQDGGYSWVPMGTTTVDLSQYATKAEVSQLEAELGYEEIALTDYPIANDCYVVVANGDWVSYTGWDIAGYIDTSGCTKLLVSAPATMQYCAKYDANKTFISAFTLVSGDNEIDLAAENVAFVAISGAAAQVAALSITAVRMVKDMAKDAYLASENLAKIVLGNSISQDEFLPSGTGFINTNTKILEANTNFDYYAVPNNGYNRVVASLWSNADYIYGVAFYSGNAISAANFISGVATAADSSAAQTFDLPIPDNCDLVVFSNRRGLGNITFTLIEEGLEGRVFAIEAEIEEEKVTQVDFSPEATGQYIQIDGSLATNANYKCYIIENDGYVSVTGRLGVQLTYVPMIAFYSGTPTADTFISGIMASATGEQTVSGDVVDGCTHIVIVSDTRIYATPTFVLTKPNRIENKITERIEGKLNEDATLFVSPSGNDTNTGISSSPLATIDKALELGANVILLDDGVYSQKINLSLAKHYEITIKPKADGARPIFKSPNATIISSGVTTESGDVKKVNIATIPAATRFIFVEGNPDPNTLISESERHPLQRGLTYRLENTIIRKVRASINTKADAVSAIQDSTDFLWWHDSDNGVLYFKSPVEISATNPIVIPEGSGNFFTNQSRLNRVVLQDFEVWYQAINLYNMSDCILRGMSAKYVCNNGGILWDRSTSVTFIKCEAAAVTYNSNGDGFNGHGLYTQETYHSPARICTDLTIDCWGHDNQDDGHSSHELCETTIIGGLFEYNGKFGVGGGVGAEYSVSNCMSRKNLIGFGMSNGDDYTYDGDGTMICYSCHTKENSYGGFLPFGNAEDTGKPILDLYQCVSENDYRNYRNLTINGILRLHDCRAINTAESKFLDGDGTIEIVNSSLVAPQS